MNTITHPPCPTRRLSVEREGHSGSGVTPDGSGAAVPKGQTGAGARPERERWVPNAALGTGRCRVSRAPRKPRCPGRSHTSGRIWCAVGLGAVSRLLGRKRPGLAGESEEGRRNPRVSQVGPELIQGILRPRTAWG